MTRQVGSGSQFENDTGIVNLAPVMSQRGATTALHDIGPEVRVTRLGIELRVLRPLCRGTQNARFKIQLSAILLPNL